MTPKKKSQDPPVSALPPPVTFGLPERFTDWRRYQDDAILDLGASEKRYSGLVVPTGGGKSLSYMAFAILCGARRVVVLTSTKSLQDQLSRDFDVVDVRGKSNYLCTRRELLGDEEVEEGTTVEDGPCQSGGFCRLRDNLTKGSDGKMVVVEGSGCPYYDRLKEARKTTKPVVTNYSFWLTAGVYGQGIGVFDLMVADEAHAAPEELAGFLSFTVQAGEARSLLGMELPGEEEEAWWAWLVRAIGVLNAGISGMTGQRGKDAAQRLKRMKRMAGPISQALALGREYWVAERVRNGVREWMTWDVVNPGPLAEKYLWRETPRIVLSSATVREKTLRMLGVGKEDGGLKEYPSIFPVERRPIFVVKRGRAGVVPRMNYRTGPEEIGVWREVIDEIIEGRRDRRGLIHTVSFQRARDIADNSRWGGSMYLHGSGSRELQQAIERYLEDEGGILVSPSATTGIDLPFTDCQYQIIVKIPYPDMRSRVMRARVKTDRDYPAYLAAQVMVQATGRGMRAAEDQVESFVCDGNWGWFMGRYSQFTPKWWRAAVRRMEGVPVALPKLERRDR